MFTRSCTTATASGAASDVTSGRMPLSRLPGPVPVEGGRDAGAAAYGRSLDARRVGTPPGSACDG